MLIMINNNVVYQQNVYIDFGTQNKSFIDIHLFLKDIGIVNNAFFLVLMDPDLAGVNPRDPRLNRMMKQKILRECITNYYYFIREAVRIPDSGGAVNSGIPYKLHRGNLALNFCLVYNYNINIELPRQHGKTMGICVRILWEFLYGTTNSEMMFSNKKHSDAKDNLQRLKNLRDALPSYLQMAEQYGIDGKRLKIRDSVETLSNPLNGNKIRTMPGARNKVNANSLGRGCTQPRQWYDEFAFILFNKIIYQSATPAYKTASKNAKNNGAPYGIIMSTTPGDMTTEQGLYAFHVKENATPFSETWYDMDKSEIDALLSKNTNSVFVYIRFTYQQLGSGEDYFKEMVVELGKDWAVIRREVLLEWSTSSENSPFKKEDLERVKLYIRQPIKTITLCRFFNFNIYKEMDRRHVPIIGVDVSGGYNQDSSAVTIIDSYTTEVVADFNCNFISIGDLTRVIYELVTKYMPMAVVNVERNGGFGATVVSELLKTRIKRNLYFEIKDRIVEERFNGMHIARTKQKTKVYGLDSSKNIRNLLMEILRERMEYHKDKFVSPIIYSELETLEVKRNGKIEHASNGHDDQIFSYLIALYVWYYGKNVMETWNIQKQSIRTDQDADEGIISLEEQYDDIFEDVMIDEHDDPNDVKGQLEYLNQTKAVSYEQALINQQMQDEQALHMLIQNNPLAKKAFENKYGMEYENNNFGNYTIPNSVFMNFNNFDDKDIG